MSDDNSTAEVASREQPPPSRLRKCRRYSHGLSRAPVAKNAVPLGERAFIACPKGAEGTCGYRRVYGCTDEIKAISQDTGGTCIIEYVKCDALVKDLVRILDYGEGEEPGEEVLRAVTLFAEAMVYRTRATWRCADRIPGIVKTPSHEGAMRYQNAGANACLRRRTDMVVARLRELGLDVERIWEDSNGMLWTWWRESCKARWMRDNYRPREEERPKSMEELYPEYYAARAVRAAQVKQWQENARRAAAEPGPDGVQ